MKRFTKIFCSLFLLCAMVVGLSDVAEAEVAKGYALIENGNKDAARKTAIRRAVYDQLISVLGFNKTDPSDMARFSLLEDVIENRNARDGYYKINKVVSEGVKGNIYCVELDTTVDGEKLRNSAKNIRVQLRTVNQNQNRNTTQISVVAFPVSGEPTYERILTRFIGEKSNLAGSRYVTSEEVADFLMKHSGDANFGAEARNFAKPSAGNAASYIYGTIKTVKVEKSIDDLYIATVSAKFNMGAFEDTNDGNIIKIDLTTSELSTSERVAVEMARIKASVAAINEFGKKAAQNTDMLLTGTVD